jgi:hypothetical protein
MQKVFITEDKKGTKVQFTNFLKDPLQLKMWLNYPNNKEGKRYTKKIDKDGWYFDLKDINDILKFLYDREFTIDYFGHLYQPRVESPELIPYEKRIKTFTKEEIGIKRLHIHDSSAIAGNFKDLTPSDLEVLFNLYDKEFFGGLISKRLNTEGSMISFEVSESINTYGVCIPTKIKNITNYTLSFPITKYLNLFRTGEKELRAGGAKCWDRLSCLQLTFEHELMHLIIMLYKFPVKDKHGKLFQCMMDAFFNQHGLYPSYTEGDVYGRLTRDTANVGMSVEFEVGGVYITGVITKLLRNTARVEEIYPEKGRIWYGVKYSNMVDTR